MPETDQIYKKKNRKGSGKSDLELTEGDVEAPSSEEVLEKVDDVLAQTMNLAQRRAKGCGCGGVWI